MSSLCLSASVCCMLTVQSALQTLENHPRPDWARNWMDLNGEWLFDFDPEDVGIQERWFEKHNFSKTIRVPYPWQSELSGIQDTKYQGAAWYERDVTIPAEAGPRVFLVFGAVDWHATVWVNGRQVAEHEGGYTPFEVELTPEAKPGETVRVTLRAYDVTDPETPNGKQTGWYTPTGGIWQTVYLESRGNSYLRSTRIEPDIDQGKAVFKTRVAVDTPGTYLVKIAAHADAKPERYFSEFRADLQSGEHSVTNELSIPDPLLWSPDEPHLYGATITLSRINSDAEQAVEDEVKTYFGMRKVSRGRFNDNAYEYILLNNKPVYLRGALHQSFSPEGIYTHPNDDYIRRDYEKAKELGLNFIRIHIKIDEPRCLYWADRLGILLMCDMPNYQRHTPRSQRLWEETMRAAIERDFNHPSIFAWCCFNETWGIGDGGYDRKKQEWVRDMFRLTKQLDPTRLVEDNSPCEYDHVETDINSWHFYLDNFEQAKEHVKKVVENTYPGSPFNYAEGWKQETAPLINSEYGGVSAGSGDRDISWVFLFLTNLLRRYDKICGYVYTELEDIEWEHNGFLNYDRSEKEFHYPAGITVADLQQPDFPVLDVPPYIEFAPDGKVLSIPVLISHWSEKRDLSVRLTAHGETVDGEPWNKWISPQQKEVHAQPYSVASLGTFEFEIPARKGLLFLVAEVMEKDRRIAANYCAVNVLGRAFDHADKVRCLSFRVNEYESSTFESLYCENGKDKLWAYGSGSLTYRVDIPNEAINRKIKRAYFICEVGSKADAERLDWPERRRPDDYPQTDRKKWPTDILIALENCVLFNSTVRDDYADARGVLSHALEFHHGSHGEVIKVDLDGESLKALEKAIGEKRNLVIRFEVPNNAQHKGGISLYGENMGMMPLDPTLVLEFE